MPGLMVAEIVTDRMYAPLAAAGPICPRARAACRLTDHSASCNVSVNAGTASAPSGQYGRAPGLRSAARVRPGFALKINHSEVEDVFEVPLAFLMNPANHRLATRQFRDITRSFYEMPYGDRYVWGATAGMLRILYERIFAT